MDQRIATSEILRALANRAPPDSVTLEWIINQLSERSFGVVIFLIALLALVPGVSPIAGILLAIVGGQMILACNAPVLPRFIAKRKLSTNRFVRLVKEISPYLRRLERFVRPRWPTPFEATKRAIGVVTLLLGATLLAPIPFSYIIPAMVVMLLAFAFLEKDGMLLACAVAMATISLGITTAALWGLIEAGLLL